MPSAKIAGLSAEMTQMCAMWPRTQDAAMRSEMLIMLRKMRQYYIETIAEAADNVKEFDGLIEAVNMAEVGDDGL